MTLATRSTKTNAESMSLNKCLATLFIAAALALTTSGCVGTACDKAGDHIHQCFEVEIERLRRSEPGADRL